MTSKEAINRIINNVEAHVFEKAEHIMKVYAKEKCEEQRKLCASTYLMVGGHNTKENTKVIQKAPDPKFD